MSGIARSSGYLNFGIRTSVCLAAMLLAADLAFAFDWSVRYSSSSQQSLTDNYTNSNVNKDVGLKINNTSTIDILAKTKTDIWRLTPSLNTSSNFFTLQKTEFDYFPSVGFEYSHAGKRTNFSVTSFFNYSDIVASEFFRDIILFTVPGTRFTYGAGTSISHRLTKRDTVSWSNNFTKTDYSVSTNTLEPNTSATTSLSWRHNWTELTSSDWSTSATYYVPENNPDNDRVTFNTSVGINTRLTKKLSANARLGLQAIDRSNQDISADLLFSLGAKYDLKTTSFGFNLARDITPAADGSFDEKYSIGFNASHQINDLTSFGFATNYLFRPVANGPDSHGFTLSPSLNYKLAKDWNASLAYKLSGTEERNNEVWSNSLLFNLSYNRILLP